MASDEAVRVALRSGALAAAEDGMDGAGRKRSSVLTRREMEVVVLVARGLTNRQAAEQLLVAPRTVETHLEHIFAKPGVQTRADVAAWAVRNEALPDRQTVT
jgi:DNA-binding CsgD family transcriptional regulator